MERSDYDGAIQMFKHARAPVRHNGGPLLSVVSLVSSLLNGCIVTYRDRSPTVTDIPMEI